MPGCVVVIWLTSIIYSGGGCITYSYIILLLTLVLLFLLWPGDDCECECSLSWCEWCECCECCDCDINDDDFDDDNECIDYCIPFLLLLLWPPSLLLLYVLSMPMLQPGDVSANARVLLLLIPYRPWGVGLDECMLCYAMLSM